MRRLLLLVACLLVLTGIVARAAWQWWEEPMESVVGAYLEVGDGSSLGAVANELARLEVLRWPRLWIAVARVQGLDSKIKRGEYRFDEPYSPAELLDILVAGRVIQYSVTLPEGIALSEALTLLQAQEPLTAILDGAQDQRLMELVAPYPNPEGLFFPDTYLYSRGETDLDILSLAYRRMQDLLEAGWESRDVGLPYQTAYEALIMASIVEKETAVPDERDRIAGVFVRRLQQGMRLQTDPTVIYGLGNDFNGNLRRRHLDDDSNAYNTYRRKGLPPTPIALPGEAALHAALHPADGTELYFVARGDGSHSFSDTLEEHSQAVRQFQMRRRSDYRSTPLPEDKQP